MDSFELLVAEHDNIRRMLAVMRKMCYLVLKNRPIDYNDFYKVTDFIRNYADKHHHGKEEELLFDMMLKELGPVADKLVRHGMLVEHDLGRLHVQELETALKRIAEGDDESRLDLIANAISYTHLLSRHAGKEDAAVYTYARRNLSEASLSKLEEESRDFEAKAEQAGIQKTYTDLLESLEKVYL